MHFDMQIQLQQLKTARYLAGGLLKQVCSSRAYEASAHNADIMFEMILLLASSATDESQLESRAGQQAHAAHKLGSTVTSHNQSLERMHMASVLEQHELTQDAHSLNLTYAAAHRKTSSEGHTSCQSWNRPLLNDRWRQD